MSLPIPQESCAGAGKGVRYFYAIHKILEAASPIPLDSIRARLGLQAMFEINEAKEPRCLSPARS